jgi:hypothetical protein
MARHGGAPVTIIAVRVIISLPTVVSLPTVIFLSAAISVAIMRSPIAAAVRNAMSIAEMVGASTARIDRLDKVRAGSDAGRGSHSGGRKGGKARYCHKRRDEKSFQGAVLQINGRRETGAVFGNVLPGVSFRLPQLCTPESIDG